MKECKRCKPNYILKAKVIENGIDKIMRDVSLSSFLIDKYGEENVPCYVKYTNKEIVEIMEDMNANHWEEWQEAERINNSHYHRVRRLKDKVTKMLSQGECIFLTLTFTDKVLESTSKETRKRYVTRVLKQYSTQYVANIDYGKLNEREHYHAIVMAKKVDPKLWKYGNLDFKRCHTTENDVSKMSKYIAKLTNHAIKETTQANYIIYSRDVNNATQGE